MATSPSSPATPAAPAAPAQPTAPAAGAAPVTIKPDTMVSVPGPNGAPILVPYGKVIEHFGKASDLERREQALSTQRIANENYIRFAQDIEQRAARDPKTAMDFVRAAVERLSGQKLGADPAHPDPSEADMTPAERAMMSTQRMVQDQAKRIDQLMQERSADRAKNDVGRMLAGDELFKQPAARELGELVALALRSQDPNMNLDDVGRLVHSHVAKIRQEALQTNLEARESDAEQVPGGLAPGLGTPGLSDVAPMTVKDARNGNMRNAIRDLASRAFARARP